MPGQAIINLGQPCDLCGNNEFELRFAGNLYLNIDPALYFSSARKYAGHWPIVRCRNCGLVQSQPRDDAETLKQVYQNLMDEKYDSDAENRMAMAAGRVQEINRRMVPGLLLDAGCAGGFFTAQAGDAGWQVCGLDPSEWSINQAKKRYKQGKFFCASLEESWFPDNHFDLIVLWDVLEHVSSPALVLSQLTPWLKKGGWLALNIPNVESIPARLMGKYWVLLLREHLWYFSPDTIQKYLVEQNYEVRLIKTNWVRFSLASIFSRLAQYHGFGFAKSLTNLPGMNHLLLRFPMGEMMVLAQKC